MEIQLVIPTHEVQRLVHVQQTYPGLAPIPHLHERIVVVTGRHRLINHRGLVFNHQLYLFGDAVVRTDSVHVVIVLLQRGAASDQKCRLVVRD